MGITILIIEADSMLQEHLVRYSKANDWRIFNSRQQKDIKRILKKHPIDVVLLSLDDLKKEGMSLIKMIKKKHPAVQVITINSGDQISLSIEGMKLGVFDDFFMPLDLDSLISGILEAYKAKKEAEVVKPSLLQRCQNIMVAASFAEAGEPDMAKELLATGRKSEANIKNVLHNEKSERRNKMKEMKVLLVDDEEEFVKALSERMKMRDLESDVALSGEQALKTMDEDLPDVMVLDLKMPGMDGMEVLRRAKKAYPGVQIIMLTGHGSEKDEQEARRLGVFEYLQKPISIEKLMKTITEAYKSKFEDAMSAAAFAEAGEFDTAREILDRDKKKK
ncbi:MAG: response regulator [Deltaproteobacteria bacterium]|nr:response regulator [Deltaproteobacteria bacterium]